MQAKEQSYKLKAIVVALLILVLLIPLSLVNGTIKERANYRQEAVAAVAESFAGPQILAGPVLVVPYVETQQAQEKDAFGKPVLRAIRTARRWIYFPSELAALARIPYPQREATPQSVISPKLHLARGSAITSDVGVAREREVGADALVLFDDAYGGFPALFWNNRYSNRVLYVPTEKLFDEAERQNATWVYVTWGDPNIYSLRAPESGWQQVGTFNVEGWGATFRRPPILRPR